MTAKYHTRCSYIGCDPKAGECLGFCDPQDLRDSIQPIYLGEPPSQQLPPLQIDVAEPDHDSQDFDASTTFIAGLIVVVLFLTIITMGAML